MQEAGIGLDVPHELGDEERVTPRLAGDGTGVAAGRLVLAAQQGQRQALGVRGLQRPQGQHPAVDAGASPFVDLEECSQERACRRIVAAVTAQKEEPSARRVDGGAPRAGPRCRSRPIADHRSPGPADAGLPRRARSSRRARKARRRSSCGSGTRAASRGAVATASASPSVGKDPDQGSDVAGQERLRLQKRQALQVSTQSIDDAVECLVGHRLLLVAPARQDNGLVAADQIVEEAPDQGGLADTRRAMDVEGHGPPPAHIREGDLQ